MTPLRIIYWILFAATLIMFWISLRTTENALQYTLAAVALWGMTYGLHRLIKIRSDGEKE